MNMVKGMTRQMHCRHGIHCFANKCHAQKTSGYTSQTCNLNFQGTAHRLPAVSYWPCNISSRSLC